MSGEIDPDSGATVPENATQPFPNPCETALDYDAQAREHMIQQYADKPKAVALISAIAANVQAMEGQLVKINTYDDPAIAAGVNLGVTGEIVGQSRVVTSPDGRFSLVIEDGGSYVIGAHTFTGLELFRLLIAQRILRNKAKGTGPEMIAALEAFVFVGQPFRFLDFGHMAIGIELATGAPPTTEQRALLDGGPVPRAMAVGFGRLWYDPDNYFGFLEDTRPGRKGFGLDSDLSLGGQLALGF